MKNYTDSDVGPMTSYAPLASGSQRFTEGQMPLTIYAKGFLVMHFAFHGLAPILWGVKKPKVLMTDNKALARFFQSKRIPPKLWNYCVQALQFNFVMAHVPGIGNQQQTTCPESTSTPRTGLIWNCTMRYPCSKLKMIWHRRRPNKTMAKKKIYMTMLKCLMQQHHPTQQCKHSWRCFLI